MVRLTEGVGNHAEILTTPHHLREVDVSVAEKIPAVCEKILALTYPLRVTGCRQSFAITAGVQTSEHPVRGEGGVDGDVADGLGDRVKPDYLAITSKPFDGRVEQATGGAKLMLDALGDEGKLERIPVDTQVVDGVDNVNQPETQSCRARHAATGDIRHDDRVEAGMNAHVSFQGENPESGDWESSPFLVGDRLRIVERDVGHVVPVSIGIETELRNRGFPVDYQVVAIDSQAHL